MLKSESNALLEQVADLLRPCTKSAPTEVHPLTALSKSQYEALLQVREELCRTALRAVRTLLMYDQNVLASCYAEDGTSAIQSRNLGQAVRSCAPLVKYKSDWAALYMLCRERGMGLTETRLAEFIALTLPDAPHPSRQNLQSGQWHTGRHRFPDWPAHEVKADKYRRYQAIAARAAPYL